MLLVVVSLNWNDSKSCLFGRPGRMRPRKVPRRFPTVASNPPADGMGAGLARASVPKSHMRKEFAAAGAGLDDVECASAPRGLLATLLLLAGLVENRHIQFVVRIDRAGVALLDAQLQFPKDFTVIGVDGRQV